MSEWLPSYNAATYPVLAAPELPFVMPQWEEPATLQKKVIAAWATPTVNAQRQDVLNRHRAELLATVFYDPINIWFADSVKDIAGMKGKKVRATSPEQAEFLTAIGASPVNIAAGEAYTGLQRGVINGIITGAGAVVSFKWDEVVKSGFATNVLMSSTTMLVSKRALDGLSPAHRAILIEEMKAVEAEIHAFMPTSYKANIAALKAKGILVTEPSPELYQQFRKVAVDHVHPNWAKRAGPEGQKAISEISGTR
jgi:TRAP-type C4-dicarboxylate transport system substrate-binding protein